MNISLTNNPPCIELAPWHVQVTPDGNYIHATIDLQSTTSKLQMEAVFVVNIALFQSNLTSVIARSCITIFTEA